MNVGKCSVMRITRQRNITLNNALYHINGIIIKEVENFKDLGVVFDHKLNFSLHVERIVNKAYQQLGFIIRTCSHFNSIRTLCYLFKTLIRSVLEYGCVVWNPYQNSLIHPLECVQNRFLRYLYFKKFNNTCPFDFPTSQLRMMFGVESLKLRRDFNMLLFVFNVFNGRISSMFLLSQLNVYISAVPRRSSFRLFIPYCNTLNHQNSPIYRSSFIFNCFSDHLDLSFGYSRFRRDCRRLLRV